MLAGLAAAAVALTPAPALALGWEPTTWLAGVSDRERPMTAVQAALIPGLGHWMLGRPAEGALYLGLTAVPLVLGALNVPPVLFADLPEHRIPLYFLTAQEVWTVQMQQAYVLARQQTGNAGYPYAVDNRNGAQLALAPLHPDQLLDWRVWGAAGAIYALSWTLDQVLPDDAPAAPPVSQARSATLFGREVTPYQAYGAHVAGGALVAMHAGVGEEAIFRGIFHTELDRVMGPYWAIGLTSVLFGLSHLGGINQMSMAKQVIGTGLASVALGGLYHATGQDLAKPIAAHVYYDALVIGQMGWNPGVKGNNVFGLEYKF